jgi:predicted nucleic acid-binding protein
VSALFADTFYWIALTDPNDAACQRAAEIMAGREDSLVVTTDEVLSEFLAYFAKARENWRRAAGALVSSLLQDPRVRVIPQSRDSFLSGLDLYQDRPDKGYSLTDCISMQTMRREGIDEALTNDRHFEQEGFRALFRT